MLFKQPYRMRVWSADHGVLLRGVHVNPYRAHLGTNCGIHDLLVAVDSLVGATHRLASIVIDVVGDGNTNFEFCVEETLQEKLAGVSGAVFDG